MVSDLSVIENDIAALFARLCPLNSFLVGVISLVFVPYQNESTNSQRDQKQDGCNYNDF